jgi:hypothetical protein
VGKRAVGLLLLAAAALGGRVAAQRQVIRVNVDTVVVDVSVFDKAARPVTGLTADDFTIVEAGKPRAGG